MTVQAACPFCKVGQVRVSASDAGKGVTCPMCLSSFTVSRSYFAESPGTADVSARSAQAAPEANQPKNAIDLPAAPSSPPGSSRPGREPVTPPLAPPPMPGRPPVLVPPASSASGMPFVWVALICASLVLPVTYLPGGRLLALLLSLVGWALGSVAFLGQLKSLAWPVVATGLNLILMLAVMLLPTWLGLGPWLPSFRSSDADDQTTRLVPFQGKGLVATSDVWIDASLGGWQRGDLRVTLSETYLGQIVLEGPEGKKRTLKEPVVLIKLRVTNVGAAREIEFRGWHEPSGEGGVGPTLIDAEGQRLNLRRLDEGWKPQGQPPTSAAILPGATTEQWLVFDAAKTADGSFRLELPMTAFGEVGDPIRFRCTISRGQDEFIIPSPSKR